MVRWCWVNFQCWGVQLIFIQGPIALAVDASGVAWTFFFSFSLTLGDGPISTEILSQRAVKPKTTNQSTNQRNFPVIVPMT